MKKIKNEKIFLTISIIVLFLVIIFSFLEIFNKNLTNQMVASKNKLLGIDTKHPTFKPKANLWYYPFYFSVQNIFFLTIFFCLILFKLINPQENKKSLFFQSFLIINSMITFVSFWFFILPFDNDFDNYYKTINQSLLNTIPIILLTIYLYFFVKTKKQSVSFKKREFWKFTIYPILWFILVSLIYHFTTKFYFEQIIYKFKDLTTASDWLKGVSAKKYPYIVSYGLRFDAVVDLYIDGNIGQTPYHFLMYSFTKWYVISSILFVQGLIYIILIFIVIKLNKNHYLRSKE